MNLDVEADQAGGSTGRSALLLACLFTSGVVGLACEVCWIRKSTLVFGSATAAVGTVLAAFFAGLAIGSYVFGRLSSRLRRPVAAYAGLELLIGFFAIVSPIAFGLADSAFGAVYPRLMNSPAALAAARCGIVASLVVPPSVMMGGTLPLLCRFFVRRQGRIARHVGLIYAVNTLGACAGCAAAGFLLIPLIGVNATVRAAGALALLVATIAFLAQRGRTGRTRVEEAATASAPARPQRSRAKDSPAVSFIVMTHLLFFVSGLVALGAEVLWVRFLTLVIQNTVYTYTIMLTVMLGGIVIGSGLAGVMGDRLRDRAFAFGLVQALAGIVLLLLVLLPPSIWQAVGGTGRTPRVWPFLLLIGPFAVLSGMGLPLAMRMVITRPARAGVRFGSMSAVNTIGGVAGSLGASLLVLPVWGLDVTARLISAAAVVAGCLAILALARRIPFAWRMAACLSMLAAWLAVSQTTQARIPHAYLAGPGELIDVAEGLTGNIAVVRRGGVKRLEIDRLWQGEDRKSHQIMAAHVPALLHPAPRWILAIGLGAGQTGGRFLMHGVDRLDCVEIEPKLADFNRRHFDANWLDDPRTRLIIDDGRSFVAHTDRTYDIISVEVGQSFRPGVEAFYTVEFYERARRRLAPAGLLAQFVPVSFFELRDFRAIVRTFLAVFPASVLWYNTGELMLIGSNDDRVALRPNRLDELARNRLLNSDLEWAYWGGPEHWLHRPENFLAGFLCGATRLASLCSGAELLTDDRPVIGYRTAWERGTQEKAIVTLIRRNLSPFAELVGSDVDESIRAVALDVRNANLNDIVAVALRRAVQDPTESGDAARHVATLRQALRWNPLSVATNRMLGDALATAGRYREAAERYANAVRIDPRDAASRFGLAHARHRMGRIDLAIDDYRETIRIDTGRAEAHVNLAGLLLGRGEFDTALQHVDRALQLRSDYAEAHNIRGIALLRRGRPGDADAALKSFEAAVRHDLANAQARNNLGTALERFGRLDDAIAEYRAAVRIKPDYESAQRNLERAVRLRAERGG